MFLKKCRQMRSDGQQKILNSYQFFTTLLGHAYNGKL